MEKMKSTWETYKAKIFLMARYDHSTLEELRIEMGEAEKEVYKHPAGSVFIYWLILLVRSISPEALFPFLKDTALRTKKHIPKTAVWLEISGAKRALLEMVVKFSGMVIEPFDPLIRLKIGWFLNRDQTGNPTRIFSSHRGCYISKQGIQASGPEIPAPSSIPPRLIWAGLIFHGK